MQALWRRIFALDTTEHKGLIVQAPSQEDNDLDNDFDNDRERALQLYLSQIPRCPLGCIYSKSLNGYCAFPDYECFCSTIGSVALLSEVDRCIHRCPVNPDQLWAPGRIIDFCDLVGVDIYLPYYMDQYANLHRRQFGSSASDSYASATDFYDSSGDATPFPTPPPSSSVAGPPLASTSSVSSSAPSSSSVGITTSATTASTVRTFVYATSTSIIDASVTASSSSTSAPTASQSSHLSTGASIGIGVSVGVVVIILAVLGILYLRKRNRNGNNTTNGPSQPQPISPSSPEAAAPELVGNVIYEKDGKLVPQPKDISNTTYELNGSPPITRYELTDIPLHNPPLSSP